MFQRVIKRILFLHRASSKSYVSYLKKKGCTIGDGTIFFFPRETTVDITRPYLIEIGKNVQVSKNVSILTHGYDWSVIKGKYGEICGSSGKVTIGDNVFLGINATILKGVSIGNNVIIGANSLVTHDVPDGVVVAGNPARIIMPLEDYYEKRKKEQLREAEMMFDAYYAKYGVVPKECEFREYIFLFKKRDEELKTDDIFNEIGSLLGNKEQTYEAIMSKKGCFDGYDDFVAHCLDEGKKKWKTH